MSNVSVNLNYGIQGIDTAASVVVFNRAISGFQLAATQWSAADWFQVTTGGSVVSLPASVVYFVYARNLGTNNVTLNYTPNGGASTSVVLLPVGSNVGGVFLYALSDQGVGSGITALSFTATTATTPVEYFVSA
jgi:hypothetical protein